MYVYDSVDTMCKMTQQKHMDPGGLLGRFQIITPFGLWVLRGLTAHQTLVSHALLIYITAVTHTGLIPNLLFLLSTNINKNKCKHGRLIPYRKAGLGGNY